MSDVFLKLLNMSITASWLILAVVILRLLLKKAPKWISCALWALVAIRLVCPFSFESALSLIPSSETIPYDITMQDAPAIESGISSVNQVINPIIADSFTPDPLSGANPLQILIPIASIVWLIGMVVILLYALISYLRLKKSVGASIVIRDNVMACDEVRSPFILGIIKPVIYVPSSMSGETLECVLNHEMAHIKRRDHWWKPLSFLLLAVYWFNPLCWLAYILLCRDIEMACDEKVIRDMDRDEKATYSQALLNCNFPRKKIAVCPLAFGEVGVKKRVRSVLNYKKPAFWIIVVDVIVCAAVAVCFMTNPKAKEPDVDTQNSDIYVKALNHEKMLISSVQHLPVYKFDTKADLDSFKTVFSDLLTTSFDDITAAYDDRFFNSFSLMLVYVPANSGSFRYGVSDVYCDGQSFCMYIEQVNDPEVHDEMMAGWFAVVEVDKEDVATCTSFDAQLSKKFSE